MGDAPSDRPPPWWRGPAAAWMTVVTICTAILSRVPGFDVLSFHLSLAVSPLVAMASGSLSATSALEVMGRSGEWLRATHLSLRRAALVTLVPLVGGLLSGLFRGPCDLGQGLAYYLLWPALSVLVAVPVGLWCGTLGKGRARASALWVAAYLLSFVPAAADFYRHPPIFFHAPFLGRYPGALYDVAVEIEAPDVAFRLACLLGTLALWLGGWARQAREGHRRPRIVAAVVLAGLSVGILSQGARWGFRVTRTDLEAVLPHETVLGRCRLRHDGSLTETQAGGILRDCIHHLRKAEAFFGLPPGPPVTLYRYRDDHQKARWLGARRVEIAKPWQDAVHLAGVMPLDPVIGHEIAHVVAGRLAPGPFRVPLRFGLVPDMARIEGLAEAVAFAHDGPSPHEWVRAMALAGLPVSVQDLFGPLAFLSAAPSRAYTVAGSFLAWVGETHGTHALREIARGRSFEEATGASLEVLDAQWREFLSTTGPSMDRLLLDRAAGRFGGPGVLGHRCAVDTGRLQERAGEALERGNLGMAEACLRRTLDLDPGATGVLRALARLRAAQGDLSGSREWLPKDPAALSPGDRTLLADLAAMESSGPIGDSQALETWQTLAMGLPPHAPEYRALAARAGTLDLPGEDRRVVLGLLAGLPLPAEDLDEVVARHPDHGLTRWFAGRRALREGRFDEALEHLVLAGMLGLPGPLVAGDPDPFRAEYPRVLGQAALGAGAFDLARFALGAALDRADYEGELLFIEDLLARIPLWQDPSRFP